MASWVEYQIQKKYELSIKCNITCISGSHKEKAGDTETEAAFSAETNTAAKGEAKITKTINPWVHECEL